MTPVNKRSMPFSGILKRFRPPLPVFERIRPRECAEAPAELRERAEPAFHRDVEDGAAPVGKKAARFRNPEAVDVLDEPDCN